MNTIITPTPLHGTVQAVASKSLAHRALICAALAQSASTILCNNISRDIAATMDCLSAMGAHISVCGQKIHIEPISQLPSAPVHLHCGESGSTLRFLLPIIGVLGLKATFHLEGRLPERPLSPLDAELTAHGMRLRREDGGLLHCSGQLRPGHYAIPGDISSQYISGLLMALPLLPSNSTVKPTSPVESAPYVVMTIEAMKKFGVEVIDRGHLFSIAGGRHYCAADWVVPGDWSGAASFLCLGALMPEGITVSGLQTDTQQGDRAILELLRQLGAQVDSSENSVTVSRRQLRGVDIDASNIPDLVPAISALCAVCQGKSQIYHAGRLRLKESNRLESTCSMLRTLGAQIEETEDGLLIQGVPQLCGGTIDPADDHRIAMAAAVAAAAAQGPVTICNSRCVQKSYPSFWQALRAIGGDIQEVTDA